MKRVLLILLAILITTGCVKIQDAEIDALVDTTVNSRYSLYNHVNSGYKYYLPRELNSLVSDEYNEVIKSKYYDYYLYVDLVAYYNKKAKLYTEDPNLYYSKVFGKDDITGIINISNVNEEYIIVVEYNYASVQVKCRKEDINECITNALVMVTTIKYNDDVVRHLLKDNALSGTEEQVNVFDKKDNDTDSLNTLDDNHSGDEDREYDPDVIDFD